MLNQDWHINSWCLHILALMHNAYKEIYIHNSPKAFNCNEGLQLTQLIILCHLQIFSDKFQVQFLAYQ